jgi:hypothetical protein
MQFRKFTIKLVSGLTVCGVAAAPLACSDDKKPSQVAPDGGSTRGDASSDASTHPKSDAKVPPPPDAPTGTETGTPGKPDGHVGTDSGPRGDAAADGAPPGSKCTAPADATKAKACLTFDPEAIKFETNPAYQGTLDGKGVLVIRIFDGPSPATAHVLGGLVYPPLPDGGVGEARVDSLPQLDFDGLPETVYVFAVFADNPLWFQNTAGLTFGTFVAGLDLSGGLKAALPVKPVALAKGKGTPVNLNMTAMRLFRSEVALGLPDAGPFGGDGQGPLSVGVFGQALPGGAAIFGTASGLCVDAHKLPVPVTGFFYGSGPLWFAGQIDDFNAASPTNPVPAGALVSIDPATQLIPDSQKVVVAADAYVVTVPTLVLTAVLPTDSRLTDYHCPTP